MLLRSIHVENYRGIRRADLVLQSTTVLIGENDCGKSSIVEALSMLLGGRDGFVFSLHHFHRPQTLPPPPIEPIRIALSFVERTPGEWLAPSHEPIWPLLSPPSDVPESMTVEVEVPPLETGEAASPHCEIRGSGGTVSNASALYVLDWIRRKNPLLWLNEGVVARESSPDLSSSGMSSDAATEKLIQLVESNHDGLVGRAEPGSYGTLQAGYEAAQALVDRSSRHFSSPDLTPKWLTEEMSAPGNEGPRSLRSTMQKQGSAAQKLGLLLLVGAVIRKRSSPLEPDAEPIVVIEDPEAHLHPMTLATVWSLIDRIKWQKIITTQSGVVLAGAPLQSIRRLSRKQGVVRVFSVRKRALTADDNRRVRYHLRSRRGTAMFARCWLLVEGETEFWLLPELAHALGYDLASEGIACVEFAQCGLAPLIKLARELGIEWHLLTDGDQAGRNYVMAASRFFHRTQHNLRVTAIADQDIEHCFWNHGYAGVFQRIVSPASIATAKPSRIISKAIDKLSKPQVALQLLEAVISAGSPGVPPPLRNALEMCVRLSRLQGDVVPVQSVRPGQAVTKIATVGGKP